MTHKIKLPEGICSGLDDYEIEQMIDIALGLEPLWENALGKNWHNKIKRTDIKALYKKM